jgi:hypothetical protein
MTRWRKRRRRQWNWRFDPSWYSTDELQIFREDLLEQISKAARPVHGLLAQASRIETELARRTYPLNRTPNDEQLAKKMGRSGEERPRFSDPQIESKDPAG